MQVLGLQRRPAISSGKRLAVRRPCPSLPASTSSAKETKPPKQLPVQSFPSERVPQTAQTVRDKSALAASHRRGCTQLEELRLNHNQLGVLPEELSSLWRLRILDVGGNRIARLEDVQVGVCWMLENS